jgi:hypothetical protein
VNRRLGIAMLALLGALVILGIAAQPSRFRAMPAPASPRAGTAAPDALRTEFLPLLQRTLATAETLVAMGDSRERNLLVIHERQSAMLEALAAADAWVTANPKAADAPAVASYQEGAREIRGAMDDARDGLLHLDFGEVARATTTMKQGATALREAVTLLAAKPSDDASPFGSPTS